MENSLNLDIEKKGFYKKLADISLAAGDAIMDIYSGGFDVETKEDGSPVTAADKAANDIITEGLSALEYEGTALPVISEEGPLPQFEERRNWKNFWLVDPLDGTKEFVKKNGEFTVNIALIENNAPVLGFVYLPVKRLLYFGGKDIGAFKTAADDLDLSRLQRLPLDIKRDRDILAAAGSRSHKSGKFDGWVSAEAERRGCRGFEIITAGSSLKFCLVAEGVVDVYPKYGPTMEWDTAAAQAVVEGAGGQCVQMDGSIMVYNKPVMKNGGFVVSSTLDWR